MTKKKTTPKTRTKRVYINTESAAENRARWKREAEALAKEEAKK